MNETKLMEMRILNFDYLKNQERIWYNRLDERKEINFQKLEHYSYFEVQNLLDQLGHAYEMWVDISKEKRERITYLKNIDDNDFFILGDEVYKYLDYNEERVGKLELELLQTLIAKLNKNITYSKQYGELLYLGTERDTKSKTKRIYEMNKKFMNDSMVYLDGRYQMYNRKIKKFIIECKMMNSIVYQFDKDPKKQQNLEQFNYLEDQPVYEPPHHNDNDSSSDNDDDHSDKENHCLN